jgi:glycerophosphoryl diester phosphodiesterase
MKKNAILLPSLTAEVPTKAVTFYLLLSAFLLLPLFLHAQKLHRIKVPKGQLETFLDPGSEAYPLISAHRGGVDIKGYPENSMEVFKYMLRQTPAILELDVSMTKDSMLILMHDRTIDRTTSGSGRVDQLLWDDIDDLKLKDDFDNITNFEIPTFDEVLKWGRKKAILSVDVKRGVPFEKVIRMIQKRKMQDYVMVITYSVEDAQKVYRIDPSLQISVSIRNMEEFDRFMNSGIPVDNMVAFTGTIGIKPDLYQKLHDKGIPVIVGTMGNMDRSAEASGKNEIYREIIEKGGDIIATDRPVVASEMIRKRK